MPSLEADLERARALDVADLADAVESIGFECTRCGACCKGYDVESEGDAHDGDGDDGDADGGVPDDVDADREPHTATVFPDEVRRLQTAAAEDGRDTDDGGSDGGDGADPAYDWRDVARPMPYGLHEGEDGPEGETFEWALAVDDCGDCAFYEERPVEGDGAGEDGEADGNGDGDADGDNETATVGACTVHDDRPLICRTYPFSVALAGTSQPMGEAVDEAGVVRAHECEGLGRDISRSEAEELAAALKERAIRELAEAVAVRDAYEPADPGPGEVVVHDSEGAKRADGTLLAGDRADGSGG